MDATTTLAALFRRRFGQPPTAILPLPRAGSNRAYFRLTDERGNTAVGVRGNDIAENRTFIYLARHFKGHRLPAPEIFGVSHDESAYLQEDLGTRSLYDALQQGREAGGNY
ncbi:MAG: phosphotransferase, partial [Alloprevotella sp.]